jgi:hypothetical protein
MSERATRQPSVKAAVTRSAGLALRLHFIRQALAESGGLSGRELRSELHNRLGASGYASPSEVRLADDLTTLRVGGWVEPVPADPERIRLTRS